ncbi:methylcobalamin:coenzyme M methyltransferase [bacterium BMS3Bbin03]|nr:methylcobalamin:coenzyme M methyltransferase [bacterium BMS3Bbin03]
MDLAKKYNTGPDFDRLRTALLRGIPDRVPLQELIVDRTIQAQFLERPVQSIKDSIEFFAKAGYDAIRISPKATFKPPDLSKGLKTDATTQDVERTWHSEGKGLVTDWKSFEKYPWPKPEEIDYSDFETARHNLPGGLKILAHYGDIFTWIWDIMGFETFSLALYEQQDLIEALFEKVGSLIFGMFKTMVTYDHIGAVWYSDDIAIGSGPFVNPDVFRSYLFPWMKKIGDLAKAYDLPYIYHSDGDLRLLLDDIIACGVDALQPIEPKALDIRELKQKYGRRLCLIGNLDLEYTLTRAAPEEVVETTKSLIRDLAPAGGYCVGSGNSIPAYVPFKNYLAMVETTLKYGKYPIAIESC